MRFERLRSAVPCSSETLKEVKHSVSGQEPKAFHRTLNRDIVRMRVTTLDVVASEN